MAWALPLAIINLPHLSLQELQNWLGKKEIPPAGAAAKLSLRACLMAMAGRGLIFLEGCDPDDERRFSLAHEIAHFLLDYLEPREQVLALLGEDCRDILDGRRPPTPEERLRGLFHGVNLSIFIHLMERSPDGAVERLQILEAEDQADRLALELLAPKVAVLNRLDEIGVQWRKSGASIIAQETLISEFGLPKAVARQYGKILIIQHRARGSFREWLGVS